jgi:hypothetical protein
MAHWKKGIEHDLRTHRAEPSAEFLAATIAQVRVSRSNSRPNLRLARAAAALIVFAVLGVVAAFGGGTSGLKAALHGHSPFAAAEVDYIAPHVSISVQGGNTVGGVTYTKLTTPNYFGDCDSNAVDSPTQVSFTGSPAAISGVSPVTCTGGNPQYSTAHVSPALTNGSTYTVTAHQGPFNMSAFVTFTVDTTAPTVHVTQVNGATRTFPYSTNQDVTSIGGTCTNVAGDGSVAWSVGSNSGTAACSSGTWTSGSFTAISSAGSYTATATQTDAAGNSSTENQTIIIDKTAPTGLTVVCSLSGHSGTGSCNGTAGNAAGDSTTLTLVIKDSSNNTVYTSHPVRTGTTWTDNGVTGIPTKQSGFVATLTQTDAAGNSTSVNSASFNS